MINNLQNTNFQSRIVISQKAYERKPLWFLRKFDTYVRDPWTLQESKFNKRQGYTDGAITCAAGLLKAKGGKEFYLFHLNPDNKKNSWYGIKKGLLEVQERLKNGNPEAVLEGFLIGANPDFSKSIDQAKNLMEFFKETGVHFTALIGQKSCPDANLHYSLPKDEITISFPVCGDVKNITDLKHRFAEVVIDEGDELQFGQKTIKEKIVDSRLVKTLRRFF